MEPIRVGELFVLGFQGPRVPEWLRGFAARYGLGGAILFDYDVQAKSYENNIRSADQVRALCAELHGLDSEPLVFVDQEGGKVRRLKDKLGFAPLPSARAIARLPVADREAIWRRSLGELAELGFDYDLAPVADLDLNPRNPDIGAIERSYSAELPVVEQMLGGIDRIAREIGIGLCLKHYPGLGSATTNSHLDLTDVTGTLTPPETEIFFRWADRIHGAAVLLSHAFVRTWDDRHPVSLSATAIAALRRHAPQALLLSDDLQMQGMQKLQNTAQASRLGVGAGLDLLVVGNNLLREEKELPAIAGELEKAIGEDPRLRRHAEQAVARVRDRKRLIQRYRR